MDRKPVLTGIGLGKKPISARLLRDELDKGHVQQLKDDEQVGAGVTRPQVNNGNIFEIQIILVLTDHPAVWLEVNLDGR